MILLLLLLIIIIFLLIFLNKNKFTDDTVVETYNRRTYRVRKSDPRTQYKTAEKLDYFRNKLQKLVDYCYKNNIPTKADASRLYLRFKNTEIHIEIQLSSIISMIYIMNKYDIAISKKKSFRK